MFWSRPTGAGNKKAAGLNIKRWPERMSGHRVALMCGASVERLDLHDRGAVIAANPEHRARSGLFDEHAPDVGGARQQILGDLAGLGVEPSDEIVHHRAGPHFRGVLGWDYVIRRAPLGRQLVL